MMPRLTGHTDYLVAVIIRRLLHGKEVRLPDDERGREIARRVAKQIERMTWLNA